MIIDDFGYYECLNEDKSQVLDSFQLYINASEQTALLPVKREERFVIVNAGATVLVPCRLLNPLDRSKSLALVDLSSGVDLPSVYNVNPTKGLEIRNAKLPEHNGEVECRALDKDGKTVDTMKFTLSFIFDSNPGPVNPPEFELSEPHITVESEHGDDIHLGDSVVLKCNLIVHESLESKIKLTWVTLTLNQDELQIQNITKTVSPSSPSTFSLHIVA